MNTNKGTKLRLNNVGVKMQTTKYSNKVKIAVKISIFKSILFSEDLSNNLL